MRTRLADGVIWKIVLGTHRGLFGFLFVLMLSVESIAAPEAAQPPREPFAVLFDTGSALGRSVNETALGETDRWRQVPAETLDHAFRGDAVLRNNAMAILVQRGAPGAAVYAYGQSGPRLRALIRPSGGGQDTAIREMSIARNTEDAVALAVTYDSNRGTGFVIELTMGLPFIKTKALGATTGIRVEAPCRFAVLPDFFADDIVLDATEIPVDWAEQPSEHFLVHLLDGGNSIVMTVWDDADQDVAANLSGSGANRKIQSVDIAYGKAGSVWVALLEEEGIWHVRDIGRADLGHELALDWRAPYKAIWRVDWRRTTGLTDSWEMVVEAKDGTYAKPDLFKEIDDDWAGQRWWSETKPRQRWNTVLGRFLYPAWFDKEGKPFLQPIKEIYNWSTGDAAYHGLLEGRLWIGPAIIFPIDRTVETPIDKFTVVDVVRMTLGVGPCQYILDVEGQQAQFKGRPTCAVRDTLNEIYEKGEQIQRRGEVEQALDDVITFIKLIRTRIEVYVAFGESMAGYLADTKTQHPELADFVDTMEKCNGAIAEAFNLRREGIRSVPFAQELVDRFRRDLADYTGADASRKCDAITIEFVHIGDNQDELVAECRVAVKILRQQAALAVQTDPRVAAIVREIRDRTRNVLREPVSYEGARH
jgi:hypothetical protein